VAHRSPLTLLLGLLLVVAAAPATARAGSGTIRVALVERTARVELTGSALEIVDLGRCDRCPRHGWRADLVRAVAAGPTVEIDGRRAAGFRVSGSGPIRMNGREYPASVELLGNGDGIAVVNEVPLEEYLAGVLLAETGDRWPLEALRAQAIASRTFAAYHRGLAGGKPYQIVASTAHQLYAGQVPPTSAARAAVRDTAGQVLLWEGALFPAFYHADSGGFTDDPRSVFAARNMPALRPVVSPFVAGSPYASWRLDLPLGDVAETLRRQGVDVGRLTAIEVTDRSPGLRAATVTLRGTGGARRLRGSEFRRLVGYEVLRSTLFAVVVAGDVAHFVGRGFGHGVGLAQWGARHMAEQGYTAAQILAFYFPGAVPGLLGPE